MRHISEGILYDSNDATKIVSAKSQGGYDTILYKSPTGLFFFHTPFVDAIIPTKWEDALDFLIKKDLLTEELLEHFPHVRKA